MLRKFKEKVLKRNRTSSENELPRNRYISETSTNSSGRRPITRSQSDGQINRNRVNLSSLATRTAVENYYTVQNFAKTAAVSRSHDDTSAVLMNACAVEEGCTSRGGGGVEGCHSRGPPSLEERERSMSTISRSVPNFLAIASEVEISTTPSVTPTDIVDQDRETVLEDLRAAGLRHKLAHSTSENMFNDKAQSQKKLSSKKRQTSEKRLSEKTPSPTKYAGDYVNIRDEPTDPGIPKKIYIAKYDPKIHESELFGEGLIFKPRFSQSHKEKKEKKISYKIFSSSGKKSRKTDEKTQDALKSCILTAKRKEEKKAWGMRPSSGGPRSVCFKRQIKSDDNHRYTPEEIAWIVQRRRYFDTLNPDKNSCVAQLHAALTADTHLFKVDLERDHAFGLGFYLYGLGPDRLVPYVSIFVKDVIKGGYVDRQGNIKPHDQIIKCGTTSFVGIKQEEALKIMKNNSQLKLIMGRRTKTENTPMTRADHLEILTAKGERWFDAKKKPDTLESGDFRLMNAEKGEEAMLYNCKTPGRSGSPSKTIQIDTSQLARISGCQSESVGTPSAKSPTVWTNRQDFLETKIKNSEAALQNKEDDIKQLRTNVETTHKENELLKQQMEVSNAEIAEIRRELKRLQMQQGFDSQDIMCANSKIHELAEENVDLRLARHADYDEEFGPEEAAAAIRDDLSSMLHRDIETGSTSTMQTAEPMYYNMNSFTEMELMTERVLESQRVLQLPDDQGGYVSIHPCSIPVSPNSGTGSESTRFAFSNYSSRRTSFQLSATDNSALSSLNDLSGNFNYTSDEFEGCTPMNHDIVPARERVNDEMGELSDTLLYADHENQSDGEKEPGEETCLIRDHHELI